MLSAELITAVVGSVWPPLSMTTSTLSNDVPYLRYSAPFTGMTARIRLLAPIFLHQSRKLGAL